MITIAPDYPSFGEHSYDFAPERGYVSGLMKAVWDNIRPVDLLQSMSEVDPGADWMYRPFTGWTQRSFYSGFRAATEGDRFQLRIFKPAA